MKSSINIPTSLSANAVMIPVFILKHLLSPRATLYSPPPSHARKLLAVRILPSPGSRRSITSPRDTSSNLHSFAGLKFKFMINPPNFYVLFYNFALIISLLQFFSYNFALSISYYSMWFLFLLFFISCFPIF